MTNGVRRIQSERRTRSQIRRRNMRNRRRRQRLSARLAIYLFVAIIVFIGFLLFWRFNNTHFARGTTINNIDVSWLTVEQSYSKINEELNNTVFDFYFDKTHYNYFGDFFELQLDSDTELKELLSKQISNRKLKQFYLSSLSINEERLEELLYSFVFLKPKYMAYPESAYMILSEENLLEIVPEEKGTYIDFSEAYEFAIEKVKSVCTAIDFSSVACSEPEVTSADLKASVDGINNILKTSITFNLSDDCSLTLDKSTMKDWLYSDCNGNYCLDLASNIPNFVNQISEMNTTSTASFEFDGTGIGKVTVPAKNLPLDEEAMVDLIKSELGSSESYTHSPIYDVSIGDSYVEIDISRQHVWMYKNGKCIVDTDCVTGTAGNHDTPPGYFFLTDKVPGKTLRGSNDDGSKYAAPVSYWLPFNGGIGLHDASWRATFGGTIYITNGSHGCVNLPTSAAKTIYENIDMSTPIIVYSSIIK